MIAKFYNLLAVVSIATVLASGGFFAFLMLGGRLNAQRAQTIAAVLRGELDDEGEEEPETEAAGEEEVAESASGRGPSESEVRAARRRDRLHGQALERAKRDLEARQRLLDQAVAGLISEQETLSQEKGDWAAQRDRLRSATQDKGFEQVLELVSGMQPKQAKEHIIFLWKKQPADAVRLLMHLDVSRSKRILGQMKTPEELDIMSQLLEQLHLQDPDGYDASESGTTGGETTP